MEINNNKKLVWAGSFPRAKDLTAIYIQLAMTVKLFSSWIPAFILRFILILYQVKVKGTFNSGIYRD